MSMGQSVFVCRCPFVLCSFLRIIFVVLNTKKTNVGVPKLLSVIARYFARDKFKSFANVYCDNDSSNGFGIRCAFFVLLEVYTEFNIFER